VGHPDFGQAFPCECQNGTAALHGRLVKYANLPHADAPRTFENFQLLQGTEQALTTTIAFAHGKAHEHILTLVGRNGCGKSHLLEAMARSLLADNIAVKYAYSPQLLDELRSSYDPSAEVSYERVLGRYTNAEVLILDDLGAERITPWAVEKLEMLVDERYRNGKRLAVATNQSMEGLADKLGPRIADRLFDLYSGSSLVVNMTALSYRTGKVWQ